MENWPSVAAELPFEASEKIMKTNLKQRGIALGTLAVLTATTLSGAVLTPAHASKSSKWKTAAIVSGVVTGYGLVKKNKTAAIVGGVATAYSYSRYSKEKKTESKTEERRRIEWYKDRYGRNWRKYYARGN